MYAKRGDLVRWHCLQMCRKKLKFQENGFQEQMAAWPVTSADSFHALYAAQSDYLLGSGRWFYELSVSITQILIFFSQNYPFCCFYRFILTIYDFRSNSTMMLLICRSLPDFPCLCYWLLRCFNILVRDKIFMNKIWWQYVISEKNWKKIAARALVAKTSYRTGILKVMFQIAYKCSEWEIRFNETETMTENSR